MNTPLLILIAIITFSVMFSISIVGPLMGILATEEDIYLGANPNFSIGIIFALGGLSLSLFQVPFSNLSDKYGKKGFIIFGCIIVALSIFLLGYSGNIGRMILNDPIILGWALSAWLLTIFRILQGIGGAATWPILMSIIPLSFTDEYIATAMGIFGASFGLGMALGPVIGPALVAISDIHIPFIFASALAIAASLSAIKLPSHRISGVAKDKQVFTLPMNRGIIYISITGFTLMFCMGTIVVIYPNYIINVLGFEVKELALLLALASLSFALLQPIFGKISGKIGLGKLLLTGLLLALISTTGLTIFKSLSNLMISMLLFGIAGAMIFPSASALVGKKSKPENVGTNTGFFNMMISLGVTMSPILVGLAADTLGYIIAFLLSPLALLIGIYTAYKAVKV